MILIVKIYITVFFTEYISNYFEGEPGQLCADLGYQELSTLNECRFAVLTWNIQLVKKETCKNYPRGCYKWQNDSSIFFNDHQVGNRSKTSISICHVGKNIYLIFNYYL